MAELTVVEKVGQKAAYLAASMERERDYQMAGETAVTMAGEKAERQAERMVDWMAGVSVEMLEKDLAAVSAD